MQTKDSFTVTNISGETSLIELCEGDITKVLASEEYDNLIISAFPNDYKAAPKSVIGALKIKCKIDVQSLSKDKAFNQARDLHCWASNEIDNIYKRITVFEPPIGTIAHEDIKNVFQFLANCLWNKTKKTACTLLGAGAQRASQVNTLEAIIVNCIRCIHYGLPIRHFSLMNFKLSDELCDKFELLKNEYSNLGLAQIQPLPFQLILNGGNNDANYIDFNLDNAQNQGCVIDCSHPDLQTNFGVFRHLKPANPVVIFDRNNELWSPQSHILCLLALIQQKASNQKLVILKGDQTNDRFPVRLFHDCYPQMEEKVNRMDFLGELIASLDIHRINFAEDMEENDIENVVEECRIGQYVDRELRYLDDFLVDIVILYNVNDSDDFEKADILTDSLRENQELRLRIHKREVRRDGGSGNYTNLQEIKKMFTAIHRARVVIALISESFLNNFMSRLEFTLAQCCHASENYPCSLVSVALEEGVSVTEHPGVKEVFTKDYVFKMVNLLTPNDILLSDLAIEFLASNGFQRIDEEVTAIFRPFGKSLADFDHRDENFVKLRNGDINKEMKRLLIIHDSQDQELANNLETLIRNQMRSLGVNVDNIVTKCADSRDIPQELGKLTPNDTVAYLLTKQFFDRLVNVDSIYELFLRTNNLGGTPFVRCVLYESQFPREVPMFVRRLPTYRRRNNQNEWNMRAALWIFSNQKNSSADVILQPKNNFGSRENLGDILIFDAEYPEDVYQHSN